MIYRWAAAPPGVWISLHLLLYAVLDTATVVVVDGPAGAGADLGWGLPLHLGALVLAAVALMFLRAVGDLSRLRFRVAAVGVFVVPAAAVTLLLSRGDATTLVAVLPMHLLMGLLVLQPRPW
jgi:hypothetical protein